MKNIRCSIVRIHMSFTSHSEHKERPICPPANWLPRLEAGMTQQKTKTDRIPFPKNRNPDYVRMMWLTLPIAPVDTQSNPLSPSAMTQTHPFQRLTIKTTSKWTPRREISMQRDVSSGNYSWFVCKPRAQQRSGRVEGPKTLERLFWNIPPCISDESKHPSCTQMVSRTELEWEYGTTYC